MALPANSSLVVSTLTKQQEDEAERLRVKELTLNFESLQVTEEICTWIAYTVVESNLRQQQAHSTQKRAPRLKNRFEDYL